ncbi:MAG: M20 family metallopeptidase [Sumerlaeia bacterium]
MTWIQESANSLSGKIVEHRRHLHQHPEVSFQEKETALYIAAELRTIGIHHIVSNIGGKHGLCATIYPNQTEAKGPYLMLRADIDALPILEKSACETPSLNPGVAHLCGHDAHTAMLLGAAEILWQNREKLPHPVRLFFQHAEEKSPGGAVDFIQQGLLENVVQCFGLHVDPRMQTGTIGISGGRLMAGASVFDIKITGTGGHAALPHLTTDPLLAGVALVNALQTIISRQIDPLEEAVISVTKFHGGQANNVIPDEVDIGGTMRSYRADWHEFLTSHIRRVTDAIMNLHQCEAVIHFRRGYCPLWNDSNAAEQFRSAVQHNVPQLETLNALPMMGGEDFAFYLKEVPGCFAYLGCSSPENTERYMLHHPKFLLDEKALPLGTAALCSLAFTELSS